MFWMSLMLCLMAQTTWSDPQLFCRIKDPRIRESSGLARSNKSLGTYFTHNDSGDTPRFFRFNAWGEVLGTYNVTGATAVDWEDMASGVVDGVAKVFIGDIGDNRRKRKDVQVYVVDEPQNGSGKVAATRLNYVYPDGAHNAETLIFDSKDRSLYIVTKESNGPSFVFRAPYPAKEPSSRLVLVGKLKLPVAAGESSLVTGGDCTPDGRRYVIRTYTSAYEFYDRGRTDDWWRQTPVRIRTATELQGEGICYSTSGNDLLTSSEFSPCLVSTVTRVR